MLLLGNAIIFVERVYNQGHECASAFVGYHPKVGVGNFVIIL
jgi:hypothetical protein